MTNEKELERFTTALAPLLDLWRAIDIRVLTVKHCGVWKNLVTRCLLKAAEPGEVSALAFTVDHPEVKAFQDVWSIERLNELLLGLMEGELVIGGTAITFWNEERGTAENHPYSCHYSSTRFNRQPVPWQSWETKPVQTWPTIEFKGNGSPVGDFLVDFPDREYGLDDALHSYRTPFDGLAGVTEHVLGVVPSPRYSDRRCSFDLIAPLEARFASSASELRGNRATIVVKTTNARVHQFLHYGYAAQNDASELVDSGTKEFSVNRSEIEFESNVETVSPARSMFLILRVGDHPVDRLTISDHTRPTANVRVATYQSLDPELSILRKALQPTDRSEQNFHERTVERTLALAGFQVVSLGNDKRLNDEVDCFAFDPYSNTLLCVECTSGAIDAGGKLGKLHMRATALSQRLQPNAWSQL